jgi:hypothetical protein
MAEQGAARKNAQWLVVFKSPDVCKTPVGSATPPIPYPVTSMMVTANKTVPHVFASGDPLFVFDSSFMPMTMGDQAGVALGTGSGTVGQMCWPKAHSPSVMAGSKYLVRNDEEFHMNGKFTGDEAAKKAARWQCRKEQIAAGKASDDPKTREAAERFERNNTAVEKAKLAQDVYDPGKGPPEGWTNISNDPEKMAKYGLTPDDMSMDGSQFRAQVYEPKPEVFGNDMKPSVAFKGTTPTSWEDWKNNGQQAMSIDSPYYQRATEIGTAMGRSGAAGSVDVVGHSLGGGMASAASRASGASGYTFNAAGLHSGTVARYGGTVHTPAVENITAYRVKGEFLTGIQEQGWKGTAAAAGAGLLGGPIGALLGAGGKVALSAYLPDALGTKFDLEGKGNPIARHGMDQVIDGIEAEKEADQKTIAASTGKSCG